MPSRFRSSPPLRLVVLTAAALATAALPAYAAPVTGKANRAAVAVGPRVERSLPIMGGTLRIAAASRAGVMDTTRATDAIALAFEEATRLEGVFAPGAQASELARLNRAADTDRHDCSADLYAVLDTALALAGETEGAFDPTCGPLERLWSEQGNHGTPPRSELSAARALVGWRMLLLEPGRRKVRFMKPGMSVELGAAAEGYVLDRAKDALRSVGIMRARLDLGDQVLAFTPHDPWLVTVSDWDDAPVVSLALSNAACATAWGPGPAGNHRQSTTSPAIDPRTGEPVRARSEVTVVAPSAMRASALAKALLVMGRDAAEAYAQAHPDLGVLWLEPAGDFVSVRIWAWNLGTVEVQPGVRLEWMTHQ
jgi:thiamine biosynthesis lipoprotein